MKTVEKYLLVSLLILLPTQLAYHFWPNWAFVFGLRVDMLAPAIYLTDILIVLLIFLNLNFCRPFLGYLTLFIAFALINTLFSTSPMESMYRWIKILEFSGLAIYIAKQRVLKVNQITKILFYSSVFFSIIGILQFIKGGTLSGFFYYFGERSFNTGTPGIALVSLGGREFLRAYSTFSHPNSLAGFLAVSLIVFLTTNKTKNRLFTFLGVLLIMICLFLTFSLSAYLGLLVVVVIYCCRSNIKLANFLVSTTLVVSLVTSLVSPLLTSTLRQKFVSADTVSQRLDLGYIAGEMTSSHFLTGVGLGTFIVNIPHYRGITANSWLLQPAHNIFLLILAETGMIGLLFASLLVYKFCRRLILTNNYSLLLPFLVIIVTGLFDHYSLTLQQNQLLLSLLIGLSFM